MLQLTTMQAEVEEVRQDGEIQGYGAVFNEPDICGDTIKPGAFKNSIAKRRPRMLWQHNPSNVIGVWKEIEEDRKGLRVLGQLNLETQLGRELHALMKQKAVDGLSIGYQTIRAERPDRGATTRTLLEVDLWEISAVTFPMQALAKIDGVNSIRDFEKFLQQQGGFTSQQAKALASSGWKQAFAGDHRDDDLAGMIRRATEQMRS